MPISELRDMSGYDRKMCGILFCLSDLAIGTLKLFHKVLARQGILGWSLRVTVF